jgi:hypothetical protein
MADFPADGIDFLLGCATMARSPFQRPGNWKLEWLTVGDDDRQLDTSVVLPALPSFGRMDGKGKGRCLS